MVWEASHWLCLAIEETNTYVSKEEKHDSWSNTYVSKGSQEGKWKWQTLYVNVMGLSQAGGKEYVYTIIYYNYRSMWISVTSKLMNYNHGKRSNIKGTKSRHIW